MNNTIEGQREGYRKLIDLCVAASKRDGLHEFVKSINDYNGDDRYYTTLNFVKEHLYQQEINFIIGLDWKQEVSDLEWQLTASLQDNFNTTVALPDPASYGAMASVSFKNVFKDYDRALGKQGFKMGFIDTDSDEYVLVVHKIEDEAHVKDAVEKIGYPYLDSTSRKINNEN